MNAAEKKVLHVAVALFMVGVTVRILPWGIPSIEQLEEPSRNEHVRYDMNFAGKSFLDSVALLDARLSLDSAVADKVTEPEGVAGDSDSKEKSPKKKGRKSRKKQKVVRLPIHINNAGVDELCALKGVGPKLADKIIEVRERMGGFSGPQDLEKVPGIGKKKAEGILQGVIFD